MLLVFFCNISLLTESFCFEQIEDCFTERKADYSVVFETTYSVLALVPNAVHC